MRQTMRLMGLDCLKEAPWGTHICHLYEDGADLLEVLIPYFRAGVENNEYCIWVCSDPLPADTVRERLISEIPGIDFARQFEVISYDQFYARDGAFRAETMLPLWKSKISEALGRGFAGLRVSGNTSWLAPDQWPDCMRYEETLYGAIGAYPMLAICSYPSHRCGPSEVLELASFHQTMLLKQDGKWGATRSNKARDAEWEALFDGISDALLVVDEDGVVLGANSKGAELTELDFSGGPAVTLGDITARLRLKPYGGGLSPDFASAFPKETQDGSLWQGESGGESTYFEVKSNKIADESTNQRYIVLFSDVSKVVEARQSEKRARSLVQLQTSKWQAVFDGLSSGVFIANSRGQILDVNSAALRLLGTRHKAKALGLIGLLTQHPTLRTSDGKPVLECDYPIRRLMRGEPVNGDAYSYTDPQGCELSLQVSGGTFSAGKDLHYYLMFRDVTEVRQMARTEAAARRAAEEEATKFTELLQTVEHERDITRNVFDAMPVGVAVFDESGAVLEANRANLHLYGLPTKPTFVPVPTDLKFPDGTVVPDTDRPTRRILNGEEIVGFEAFVDNPDRGRVDLLISGGRLESGGRSRFYRVSHDITEIRKLERAKDDFMMVVSHELRNPLQVISGLVQLLSKTKCTGTDCRRDAHLATLRRQVMVLTGMVEDILAAYRIGSGKLTVEMRDVDIVRLISEVVTPYTSLATHQVSLESPCAKSQTIRADPQRMTQVLQNLLSNALKYTPEGKRIWVSVKWQDEYVIVTVEDEGIGIPEAQLELVFQGFHRAHKFGDWRSGGVGLGLYISRQLARKHGGDLWAEQRSDGGTTMKLKLPLGLARRAGSGVSAGK